ncbi:MAG: histidine kinase [Rudanella sp.]|nr:histidine kinase [Rudanella sp.]
MRPKWRGALRFNGEKFTNYTTKQGLADDVVYTLVEDKRGDIWFGSMNTGRVSRFDGKQFTTYTSAHGLAGNSVEKIRNDNQGNLWFVTDNGISRFDGKTFASFTTKDGLPSDAVYSITVDSMSNILIGTNQGLGILTGFTSNPANEKTPKRIAGQNALSNDALARYSPTIESYNTATGYPIKDASTVFSDRKGITWIGTSSDKTGLVRFDYSAVRKNKKPLVIKLQGIKINNEAIGWQSLQTPSAKNEVKRDSNTTAPNITEEVTTFGKELSEVERDSMRHKFGDIQFSGIRDWYLIPENLVLPYRHNTITFEFAAIETARPSQVNYQYMLAGYDDDWSPRSNKAFATFGNMTEGTYTFKLKAQSPLGIWSQPIAYTFTILPPWWRTWWAYLLYALLLGWAVWGLTAYRSRELKRKNQALQEKVHALEEIKDALLNGQKIERRRVAADLHDNLGGMMSAIRLTIEAMDAATFSPKEHEVYQNVLGMTRQAYNEIRLLSHNLQPDELEKFGLAQALQRLMNKLNSSQQIQFSLSITPAERLHKELEFNLYSICLELANNIIKHSQATEASFEFAAKNGHLQLLVTDNGKGFIHNNTSDGMGMRNIQERTEQMGGTLKIHSRPGEGTMFQFMIPLILPVRA